MTNFDSTITHSSSGFEREIISVSQLNRRAKQLLETHLPLLWIEGELSNVSQPSSGHWYFTLKDDQAQVRCAMFRNRNMMVRFKPQQGQQVLLRARVSLYEGRGDYQLIAEHMEEAGAGALQRAFEELKNKLANEGLFDTTHKRELPSLPQHIGVITSPTGAAVRDVLSVLERRFPAIPVTILPVAVQGKEAAPQIVKAIERANRANLFDILLVTRGGGSLEDLWPFNEESVARAIHASRLPIVSAVGHEVDFTIADYVADLRAPTPSAAAELIAPDGDDWLETFIGYELMLEEAMARRLRHAQQKIEWLRSRLRHPGERLQQQAQRLDNLELRLRTSIKRQLERQEHRLQELVLRQKPQQPFQRLIYLNHQVEQASKRLIEITQHQLNKHKQRLGEALRVLQTVSPLNTLERGYAIVTDASHVVIHNSQSVKPGDRIQTRLAQGELHCLVEKVVN
jgi:exodeoxyribonuclease VII large subunit